ncbi:MAG: flotillin domain-containing protein [Pseudomonadota bacterium]
MKEEVAMDLLNNGFLLGGLIVVVAIILVLVASRLFRRASKELAYVKTGLGGSQVVLDKGKLIFPVFHEIVPVNLKTLKLVVRRAENEALITHDKLRADVTVEFYVRVQRNKDSIEVAAQTLGERTNDTAALKELVEGKFVDALRAVAAQMTLEDLHLQRSDFVQRVQGVVAEDLQKNGLELESASLTGLDQTDQSFFNPENAFDAEGLTKLKQQIEEKRERRFVIEQETEVAIKTKELEATEEKLTLAQRTEEAKLNQEREIAIMTAQQMREVAEKQAVAEQLAESAKIEANRNIETARIAQKRDLEIEDQKSQIDIAKQSEERVAAEASADQAKITAKQQVDTTQIENDKQVELSRQLSDIAIAEQSKELSVAEAEAARVEAEKVRETERVATAKAVEVADRHKQVELVQARQEAEKQAVSVTVAAEAERLAADERAAALRVEAEADADAERTRAEAKAKTYEVEAAGQQALNDARNVLSEMAIGFEVKMKLVENLPEIVEQMVKPMEQIDSIRIVDMGGMGSATDGANGEAHVGNGNLADNAINAALRYRTHAPVLDRLLAEVGLNGGGDGLGSLLEAATDLAAPEAAPAKTALPKGKSAAPTPSPSVKRSG